LRGLTRARSAGLTARDRTDGRGGTGIPPQDRMRRSSRAFRSTRARTRITAVSQAVSPPCDSKTPAESLR